MSCGLFLLMLLSLRDLANGDPTEDFCIAPPNTDLIPLNAMPCKPLPLAQDLVSHILAKPGKLDPDLVSSITQASAYTFPALRSQDISLARLDFGKEGVMPPHFHPRASELLYVLRGSLIAGFVSSDNKLFSHNLEDGDLFVFPRGLMHFVQNVGETEALCFSVMNADDPGSGVVSNALFYSDPPISDSVVGRSFGLDQDLVRKLKSLIDGA